LYFFDTVRYFHDAAIGSRSNLQGQTPLDKADYVEKRVLWEAFESPLPRVVLIDEIDKAPRDFPNDLLHELDQMEFTVAETRKKVLAETTPIVIITSNGERRLPEAFLRRCVYHHISFDESLLRLAVAARAKEYETLSREFVDFALQQFMALRNLPLYKRPSTSELLVWLRVLAMTAKSDQDSRLIDRLNVSISELPYMNLLLKHKKDYEELT
jgi:MoxR-like ATPase